MTGTAGDRDWTAPGGEPMTLKKKMTSEQYAEKQRRAASRRQQRSADRAGKRRLKMAKRKYTEAARAVAREQRVSVREALPKEYERAKPKRRSVGVLASLLSAIALGRKTQ